MKRYRNTVFLLLGVLLISGFATIAQEDKDDEEGVIKRDKELLDFLLNDFSNGIGDLFQLTVGKSALDPEEQVTCHTLPIVMNDRLEKMDNILDNAFPVDFYVSTIDSAIRILGKLKSNFHDREERVAAVSLLKMLKMEFSRRCEKELSNNTSPIVEFLNNRLNNALSILHQETSGSSKKKFETTTVISTCFNPFLLHAKTYIVNLKATMQKIAGLLKSNLLKLIGQASLCNVRVPDRAFEPKYNLRTLPAASGLHSISLVEIEGAYTKRKEEWASKVSSETKDLWDDLFDGSDPNQVAQADNSNTETETNSKSVTLEGQMVKAISSTDAVAEAANSVVNHALEDYTKEVESSDKGTVDILKRITLKQTPTPAGQEPVKPIHIGPIGVNDKSIPGNIHHSNDYAAPVNGSGPVTHFVAPQPSGAMPPNDGLGKNYAPDLVDNVTNVGNLNSQDQHKPGAVHFSKDYAPAVNNTFDGPATHSVNPGSNQLKPPNDGVGTPFVKTDEYNITQVGVVNPKKKGGPGPIHHSTDYAPVVNASRASKIKVDASAETAQNVEPKTESKSKPVRLTKSKAESNTESGYGPFEDKTKPNKTDDIINSRVVGEVHNNTADPAKTPPSKDLSNRNFTPDAPAIGDNKVDTEIHYRFHPKPSHNYTEINASASHHPSAPNNGDPPKKEVKPSAPNDLLRKVKPGVEEARVGTPVVEKSKALPDAPIHYRVNSQAENQADVTQFKNVDAPKRRTPLPTELKTKQVNADQHTVGTPAQEGSQERLQAPVHYKTNATVSVDQDVSVVKVNNQKKRGPLPTALPTHVVRKEETPMASPATLKKNSLPQLPQTVKYRSVKLDRNYASPDFHAKRESHPSTMDEEMDVEVEREPRHHRRLRKAKHRDDYYEMVQVPISPPTDSNMRPQQSKTPDSSATQKPLGKEFKPVVIKHSSPLVANNKAEETKKEAIVATSPRGKEYQRPTFRIGTPPTKTVQQEEKKEEVDTFKPHGEEYKKNKVEMGSPITKPADHQVQQRAETVDVVQKKREPTAVPMMGPSYKHENKVEKLNNPDAVPLVKKILNKSFIQLPTEDEDEQVEDSENSEESTDE